MYSTEDPGLVNLHISSQEDNQQQQQQPRSHPHRHGQINGQQAEALPDRHKALYQCGWCKRRFTRADHLNRHVRTHTAEKPFACTDCNKAFARADLLKRHSIQHASRDSPANSLPNGHEALGKTRVTQACRACISSKVKCNEQKPCERCIRKHVTCEDPIKENTLSPDSQQTSTSSPSNVPIMSGTWQSEQLQPIDSYNPLHDHLNLEARVLPNGHSQPGQLPVVEQHLENSEDYADVLRNILSPNSISLPGNPMPHTENISCHDLGLASNGFADWNISSFSYSEEDFLALDVPMESPVGQEEGDSQHDTPFAAVSQAFRASLWHWVPGSHDSWSSEQDNLAVPAHDLEQTRIIHPSSRPPVAQQLQQSDRDRILAVVLNTCQKANISKIASNFPSSHLLEMLLQVFLQCHMNHDSFIHIPTFQTSSTRPELLVAMIASGGVMTSVKVLQRMGFAYQEVIRPACADKWENDNSTTRDLQLIQAFEIFLSIGLYSGFKRKVEISESFMLGIVTMLRRAGRFRHSYYKTIVPYATDEGETLVLKWRRWAEQESFKRLVHRLFILSSQASITLQTSPLISFSELSLPLPEQDSLWLAANAMEWKDTYIRLHLHASSQSLSLLDCTRAVLSQEPSPFFTGINYYSRLTLYALWEFVMEHRRMTSVFSPCNLSTGASTILQPFQHQTLLKTLMSFSFSISTNSAHLTTADTYEIALLAELLLLILHSPLDHVLLFAGKEGEEEARRAYSQLKGWIHTIDARKSMWHAGQLLKAARLLRPGLLRDFYAIIVYYASLVLWSYGMIGGVKRTSITENWSEADQVYVQLDGEDSMLVHRFVNLGVGNPGVGGLGSDATQSPVDQGQPFVPLIHPGAVMAVSMHILSGGLNPAQEVDGSEPLPPLVRNVLQLMKETMKAARYIYKS